MAPNLLPVCCTLGLMGWFNVPLDVATVIIAAITLGLSVDDTIHFIAGTHNNFSRASIKKVFENVGPAIVITSTLVGTGFVILVFSQFVPMQRFGLFVCLNTLLALVFDLTLLPVLLVYRNQASLATR